MNIFNRILVILLALAFLAVAFLVTVWPQMWMVVGQQMNYLSQQFRMGYTLGGVLVMLVCGLILLLEIRRPRRAKYVVVDKVTGGEARVLVDSVARRLNYEVSLLQDVSEVKTGIRAKGRGLKVALEVLMAPDVDVPMKTDEIIETARRVVEEHMGLRLAGKPRDSVQVNIRHPKEIAPARRELPTVTPAAEPAPEPSGLEFEPAPAGEFAGEITPAEEDTGIFWEEEEE